MSTSLMSKKPLREVATVKDLLMNAQAGQQLQMVAAKHISPERMMRLVANALRTTPKLGECEPMSLLGALMQCASMGLEPNTVLGQAYLVPFKNTKKRVTECQVIVGYKGLIDLARRSGHITSIAANVHYSDDELWIYEEGTEAQLRHRPGPQDGDKMHAYAIAKFRDGGHAYVVLPWSHVMKIRDGSQNWQTAVKFNSTDRNPWKTHEDEMARKTAIRALAKYLPLSVEFRDALQVDHDGGAAMDYGAFAMRPEQGVQPADDVIDGEASEPEPQEQPKDDPKPEPKAERKEEPKGAVDPKETGGKPAADKPNTEDSGAKWQRLRSWGNDIIANLLDAGAENKDAVLSDFKEQLREIEAEAPDIHEDISATIEGLT